MIVRLFFFYEMNGHNLFLAEICLKNTPKDFAGIKTVCTEKGFTLAYS